MSIFLSVLQTLLIGFSLLFSIQIVVLESGLFRYISVMGLGVFAFMPLAITFIMMILFLLRRKNKFFSILFWVLAVINLYIYIGFATY